MSGSIPPQIISPFTFHAGRTWAGWLESLFGTPYTEPAPSEETRIAHTIFGDYQKDNLEYYQNPKAYRYSFSEHILSGTSKACLAVVGLLCHNASSQGANSLLEPELLSEEDLSPVIKNWAEQSCKHIFKNPPQFQDRCPHRPGRLFQAKITLAIPPVFSQQIQVNEYFMHGAPKSRLIELLQARLRKGDVLLYARSDDVVFNKDDCSCTFTIDWMPKEPSGQPYPNPFVTTVSRSDSQLNQPLQKWARRVVADMRNNDFGILTTSGPMKKFHFANFPSQNQGEAYALQQLKTAIQEELRHQNKNYIDIDNLGIEETNGVIKFTLQQQDF